MARVNNLSTSKHFCILRTQKIKSAIGITRALKHNSRTVQPDNANPEKTSLNTYFNSFEEALELYRKKLPEKIRKNAVHAIEVLITASPEALEKMTKKEQIRYFNESVKWAETVLGGRENLLSACIHRDEATPHLHIIFMPLKDKKLNANYYIGGSRNRMIELQDDFYNTVGKKFNLERGLPKAITKAKHLKSRDYLAQKGQQLAQKEQELDEQEKNLIAQKNAIIKFTNALSAFKQKELKRELEREFGR